MPATTLYTGGGKGRRSTLEVAGLTQIVRPAKVERSVSISI